MNEKIRTKYGTATLTREGYYRITSAKEGNNMKWLHRLIYEDFHGCKIPEGYVVHHKNGNKTDNCISNLQLMKLSEHMSMHNNGENNHMYGKKHTPEARRKMSENAKGRYVGKNNPRAKYTLWNIQHVYFNKTDMPADISTDKDLPKCFHLKYNGKNVRCGGFGDFITVEIISELINQEVKE